MVPHGRRLGKLADFLSLGSLRDFVLFNACEVLPGDLKQLGMSPIGYFPFRQQILQEAESLYPVSWRVRLCTATSTRFSARSWTATIE